MKKLIASAVFVVATALSGAAFADDSGPVNAGGDAQQLAHLGNLTITQQFSPSFINPSNSLFNPGTKLFHFPGSLINYVGLLGIKSANGAITGSNAAPVGSGFVDKLNYTATATFGAGGPVATYTTNGSVVPTNGVNKSNVGVGPSSSTDVLVSLVLNPTAAPAIAGVYNDVVTVVLGTGV